MKVHNESGGLSTGRAARLKFLASLALLGMACGQQNASPLTRSPTSMPSPATPIASAPLTTTTDRCGSSLQAAVDSAPPGSVLDLTGCTYTAGAVIRGPLTIVGASIVLPARSNADRWVRELVVAASDVTLERLRTQNGANVVAIEGDRRNIVVRDSEMRGQIGSAIWIKGPVNDVLLERLVIVTDPSFQPTAEPGVSPIRAEGCSPWPCEPLARRIVVRDSMIDQGPYLGRGGPGWYGIELIRAPDSVIERTTVRGGHTRVSIPNSDRTVIRDNVLDLGGGGTWGIEVAGASDVRITGNRIEGDSAARRDGVAAISFNATSGRTPTGALIEGNVILNVDTAFQLSGNGHRLIGNCFDEVDRIYYAYGGEIGPAVEIDTSSRCTQPGG